MKKILGLILLISIAGTNLDARESIKSARGGSHSSGGFGGGGFSHSRSGGLGGGRSLGGGNHSSGHSSFGGFSGGRNTHIATPSSRPLQTQARRTPVVQSNHTTTPATPQTPHAPKAQTRRTPKIQSGHTRSTLSKPTTQSNATTAKQHISQKLSTRQNNHASPQTRTQRIAKGFAGPRTKGWRGPRDHDRWGRGWYRGFRCWGGGWGWGVCTWSPLYYPWLPSLAYWSLVLNGRSYYVPQVYVENTYIIQNKEITGWKGLSPDKDNDSEGVVLTVDDLYESIKAGRKELVEQIIANKPLLCKAINGAELNPLMSAIRYNQVEIAVLLAQAPETILSCATKKGLTALHMACQANMLRVVEAIIATGNVDLNVQEKNNNATALHIALEKNSIESAQALIRGGARTDIPNKNKKTAAQIAISKKLKAVVELLNGAPTSSGEKDAFGFDPEVV